MVYRLMCCLHRGAGTACLLRFLVVVVMCGCSTWLLGCSWALDLRLLWCVYKVVCGWISHGFWCWVPLGLGLCYWFAMLY